MYDVFQCRKRNVENKVYNANKSVASCTFTKCIIRLSTLLKRCKKHLKRLYFYAFGENRDKREKEKKHN